MPKPQDIFQLARQEAVRVTASPQVWQSFLYTAAHNYHTTYLNQLLIHAQRPDAAACASMEYWNTKANRLVMRGSRSITVLQRRQGVAVTKPVFAIGDTTLLNQMRTGGPWEVTDTTRLLLLQGKPDDWLTALAQEGISSEADRARRMLERNVADSTLQWAQPDEQMQLLQALVTQSAVYMARLRIGLPVRDEDYPAFQSVSQFDTCQISLCLGGYVQAAAEPMLNAIGREALRLNRDSIPLTATESLSLAMKMPVTAENNYNRNKNVIVFGPSGSGKSYSIAGPQLLQFNSNYVLSDPKGELLDTYGNVLVSQGYDVKVFNLKDRDKSDHYNPFAYIHDTDDIVVVAKNLIKNMKEDPRQKNTADPIWEEGSTSLLEALLAYVYFEQPPEMHNMNSVMELFVLMQHRYGPQGRSQLDDIFEDLAMEKPASFAARQYGLYHMAPDKTAQSIDVSLGMRMSAFNIPSIMKICEDDTIHLEELTSDKKVALFVVTPDTTTAYNFLAAVMFQQCFQILVHTADNREDHCLPRHVRFLLDEFPNIGMIPDFQILISTIRSRNIGCTLIYQSIAQLKSQYGDDWGTILENCDSELVLGGGNNPESLEFFGKQLGKRTIEVLNTTENLGAQGSFSKNYQVASRDLMTPEEIRTMPRNRCLLMISGVVPFYSYKFDLKKHPNYALVEKEGHHPFDYERRAENSFAAFMKNVQEINNIELDDDESDT